MLCYHVEVRDFPPLKSIMIGYLTKTRKMRIGKCKL